MSKQVQLLKHQMEAIKARETEVLLLGGIAGGKTLTGAFWIIDKVAQFPSCDIILAANTYQQLMNASVKTLTQLLDELGIEYRSVLSGSRKRVEIGNATVFLYSLDAPDSIRGVEASFCWLDEVAFSSLYALQVIRGRMRGSKSTYRQILMTTSGNGFNWLYDIFGNIEADSMSKRLISAQTADNTFLPDGYYDQLVDTYGGIESSLAQQELFGKFVNLQTGAIYNLFSRAVNVKPCKLDKNYPVYANCDFNIDQMSATYVQYINGIFYQCEEVSLTHRDANTFDLANRIVKDLVKEGYQVSVITDSTGKARKTSSAKTDHQILKDAGLNLLNTSNPRIRDRHNTVNIRFNKQEIFIDPSCVNTIKEIETLSSKDIEGKVVHLSVTLGYCVWKLQPLKKKKVPARQILF